MSIFKKIIYTVCVLSVVAQSVSCSKKAASYGDVNMADVATGDAVKISCTHATLLGSFSPALEKYVSSKGIIFILKQNTPDFEYEEALTLDGTGTEVNPSSDREHSFTCEISSLSAEQTYYYRAFIVVSGKMVYYGDIKSFTTEKSNTYSDVSPGEADEIGLIRAEISASLTYDTNIPSHDIASMTCGFVYSREAKTQNSLKSPSDMSAEDNDLECFSTTDVTIIDNEVNTRLINLHPASVYFYRPFIKYGNTYYYSNVIRSFTTKDASYISLKSVSAVPSFVEAELKGSVDYKKVREEALSNSIYTGYLFSTKDTVLSVTNKTRSVSSYSQIEAGKIYQISGSITNNDLSVSLPSLLPGTTIYYVPYIRIGYDLYVYGSKSSFKTKSLSSIVVTTQSATNVGFTSGTISSKVDNSVRNELNPYYSITRGFYISDSWDNKTNGGLITSSDTPIKGSLYYTSSTSSSETQSFTFSRLNYETTYDYYAYIKIGDEIIKGNSLKFNTKSISSATPTTGSATNVGILAATLNGTTSYTLLSEMTSIGSISRGFVISTSSAGLDVPSATYLSSGSTPLNPGTKYYTSTTSYSTNDYSFSLSSLSESTTYYYRAYLKIGTNYLYGGTKSFTTSSISAITVATSQVSNLTSNSVTLTGSTDYNAVSSLSGAYSIYRGFVFSTSSSSLTVPGATSYSSSIKPAEGVTYYTSTSGLTSSVFNYNIYNLSASTRYYYKAYVRIGSLYIYGPSAVAFTTKEQTGGVTVTSIVNWSSAGNTYTSTNKTHNSTGTINATVSYQSGYTLSIPWTVSSETNYDKLTITLDGTIVLTKSGIDSGTYEKTFTSAGTATLVIKYSKDSSNSSGSDQATVTLPLIQ